ncbi:MAG TPA: FliH/SctL family protein [Anaeromyxobacter sp.]|nr:FliH/SctL family protein [Anaeromyxobacter sp.]
MATILKAAAPLSPRRIPVDVVRAGATARELLAAAEGEAVRIREEARAERSRIRAEEVEAGRREGLGQAAAALALVAAERDRRLGGLAREVAAIGLDVARRLLGRELGERPEAVADLAAAALAVVRDRREVTLRVHPSDAPVIQREHARLAGLLSAVRGLGLREDPALEPGSVVVETEAGWIDARVEAQLGALERALAELP